MSQPRRMKVTFDLHPTIFHYTKLNLTDEAREIEEKRDQAERWEDFLEKLQISPTVIQPNPEQTDPMITHKGECKC